MYPIQSDIYSGVAYINAGGTPPYSVFLIVALIFDLAE